MQEDIISYRIIDISVSDIIFPKEELRSHVIYEGLDELARSIRSVGLLNPITVRKVDTKYELIAGYRRLKACEIVGFVTIPARVITSDDTRADLQKLHENMFREEVNPIDEGSFFKRLLVKNNWRIIDLAVQLHKSPTFVSRRVQLTDADPMVVAALRDNQINISVADELIKIDDPDTRSRLLHYAVKSGATVETVRSWRIQYESDILPPPAQYVPRGASVDSEGNPIVPMPVMFDDIPPPAIKLTETINETRPCFSCMDSFDTHSISVIFLCPACRTVFENALRPDQNNILDNNNNLEIKRGDNQ